MTTGGDSPTVPAPDRGPGGIRSFRAELDSTHYASVNEHWAGDLPAQYGVAPRVRVGKSTWFNLLWLIPMGLVLLVIGIAVAKGIRDLPAVQDFIQQYPGESDLPDGAPVGFPAWLGWQHFLNAFLQIFIIRSGVTIIADHHRRLGGSDTVHLPAPACGAKSGVRTDWSRSTVVRAS